MAWRSARDECEGAAVPGVVQTFGSAGGSRGGVVWSSCESAVSPTNRAPAAAMAPSAPRTNGACAGPVTAVAGEERHLATDLKVRDVCVEVQPVHTLDLQTHMAVEEDAEQHPGGTGQQPTEQDVRATTRGPPPSGRPRQISGPAAGIGIVLVL